MRLFNSVGYALIALLLVIVGCQRGRKPDYGSLGLANASGTVRLDGAPLANAHIVFEDEDGSFSHAVTDAAGRYRMMYSSEQSGVLPGRKTVRITLQPIGEDAPADRSGERIHAGYNEESQLTVEVVAGSNTFNFELNSSGP